MRTLNYLAPIFIIITFSCNNDKSDDTSKLSVGVDNGNVLIYKFNPPITIVNPDSDSIDLNGDSRYDLIFIKSPIALLTGFGIKTEMIKKSGVQIILSSLNDYPDTLSYSTELDNQSNWSGDDEQIYALQSYDCQGGNNCIDIGNFLNFKESYLGIKLNNKFGWVKLYNEAFAALEIREYSIMK